MAATTRLVELTDGIWVATSRWYATTSTVLLDGHGGALVVDPAFLPDELAAIPLDLRTLGVTCLAGLSTHEHYDHVLWHPDLGEVPRWTSDVTVASHAARREDLLAPLAEYLTPDLIAIAGRLSALPDGTVPWAGPTAQCIQHDAHAPGHLALLLPEAGVLVAGDMLSDVELPMPTGDESLTNYLIGLERLRDAVGQSQWVIPGHGTPARDVIARYDADRRYVEDLLSGRASDDPRINPDNAETHEANLQRVLRER